MEIILSNKKEDWEKIVKIAMECHGDPKKFWQKISILRGQKTATISKPLIRTQEITDSEDSDFDNPQTTLILNKVDQSNHISETWSKVFHPHDEPHYNSANTQRVQERYDNILPQLQPSATINFDKLITDHPLQRPIENSEYQRRIKTQKVKAPGISNITLIQMQHLPPNVKEAIINVYDSILASFYYPKLLKLIKMIFLGNNEKDTSNPLNFRPISQIEIIGKTFEKIIYARFNHYIEHNNLLTVLQFGFRKKQANSTHNNNAA